MLEQMRQEEALKFLDDSLDVPPAEVTAESQEVVPSKPQEKPVAGRIRTATSKNLNNNAYFKAFNFYIN